MRKKALILFQLVAKAAFIFFVTKEFKKITEYIKTNT